MQGWGGLSCGGLLTPSLRVIQQRLPGLPQRTVVPAPGVGGRRCVQPHVAAPLLQVGRKVQGSPRPARNGALLAESQGGIPGSQKGRAPGRGLPLTPRLLGGRASDVCSLHPVQASVSPSVKWNSTGPVTGLALVSVL